MERPAIDAERDQNATEIGLPVIPESNVDAPLSRVTLGRTLRTRGAAGLLVHDSTYDANAWMPRHSHRCASVTVVLAGEQLDMAEGRASRYVGLMVIMKPSGLVHETECGPAGCRSATIEVPARMEAMLRGRFGLFARAEHLDSASAAAAVIGMWGATRETDDSELLESEWLRAARELAACSEVRRPSGACELAGRAMPLLEAGWGAAEIAAELRVHPVHLCRVMKHATGRSTVQNIRRQRVRRGIERVLAGGSLVTAALEAGFSDQSHMTREVAREIGMTPARFCRAADV